MPVATRVVGGCRGGARYRPRARRSATALILLCLPASCMLIAPSGDELASGTAPCPPGTKDCSGSCVPLDGPATGCAGAGCEPCALPHALATCEAGSCAVELCENGWADCDGEPTSGCELALPPDIDDCRCHAIRLVDEFSSLVVDTSSVGPIEVGSDGFTVEAWVMAPAIPAPPSSSPVFTSGARETPGGPLPLPNFSLSVSPTDLWCRVAPSDVNNATGLIRVEQAIQPNRWTHLACLHRGDRLLAYVNGVEAGRTSLDPVQVTLDHPVIGSASGNALADLRLGPMRVSRGARYEDDFTPITHWPVDDDTLLQFLAFSPYAQVDMLLGRIQDESGKDLFAISTGGVERSDQTPCDTAE